MSDENRALYTPPGIAEKRKVDLKTKPKRKKLRLFIILFLVIAFIGGTIVFFTDPRVLNGLSIPSILNSDKKVPVAILKDTKGNKVLSSLGCVVSFEQFGVAPLEYFERINKEKRFKIENPPALMEAFGCLMPSLLAHGLETALVSVEIGSDVFIEMPYAIHGVFNYSDFKVSIK